MAARGGDKPWCLHCDLDRARRRDGICDACNSYRWKYGELPSRAVLHRRLERREERRHEAETHLRTALSR